jgi:hypothetical protein
MALWGEVPDATENEAYELLVGFIPKNFRTLIFEEEEKKFGETQLVRVSNIGDLDANEAKRYFSLVFGVECSRMEKVATQKFLATVKTREEANRILAFNGRRTNGTLPLEVCILEQHLPVTEIFTFIGCKLASRDRSDAWSATFPQGIGQSHERIKDTRRQRVTTNHNRRVEIASPHNHLGHLW